MLLNSASQLQFRDSGLKINSSADGQLDIDADTEVEINTLALDLTGRLRVNDGSASSPSLSFRSDTDTGFSLNAADNYIGVAFGGANYLFLGKTNIQPQNDNSYDLGTSSRRFDDVYATNGTIQTSDRRLKKDIVESGLGLRFIKDLNPVSYRWKRKDNGKHYGLIAQELLEAYRENGLEDRSDIAALDWDPESDRYGLRYSELISPMIKAIQELSAKVEKLESKLNVDGVEASPDS